MINHGRTLLINTDGGVFSQQLGEEIIPADYQATTLLGSLHAVRRVLFGSQPDQEMLNYRSRQLLAMLHSTELVEYLTDLDPRITYDFDSDPFFDEQLYRPVVENLAGDTSLWFVGEAMEPDASGKMLRSWIVTIESGNIAEVRQYNPSRASNESYTITSGVSNQVPLVLAPNRYVQFAEPTIGDQWRVYRRTRPQTGLGEIQATLRTIGEPTIASVFQRGTERGETEPFVTFRKLWEKNTEVARSLGGLIMALIYHTDDLRQQI